MEDAETAHLLFDAHETGKWVFEFCVVGNAVNNFVVCLAHCCRTHRRTAEGDSIRA
jgi:hypothetical protein